MTIRITCPGCEKTLALSDDKRGKKVRCKSCEKVLSVPAINGKPSKHDVDEDEAVQDEPRLKKKKAVVDEEEDDGDEEEKPAKKKKKKKKDGGFPIVLVASLAVVFLLLVGGGALVTYFLTRPPAQQAKVQQQPEPQEPPAPPRIDVPRNPKTTAGNIRARIERTRLDNELNQIKLFFTQYDLNVSNPNARTLDGFLKFIERDSKQIHDSIKEKFYTMNMKARLDTDSIICCETEPYNEGYYAVKSGGTIGFISPQEAKAAGLAVPPPPAP